MSWPGNVQRPSGPPGANRRNRTNRIASLTHRDALSRPPNIRRTSVSGLTSGAPKTQRTSKTSQKLVVLPSAPQTRPLPTADDEDLKFGYETDAGIREYKSQAERMNKDQRERAGFKRITAYCVAESFRMKLLASFVKREHNVSPRIFDEAVYCMYHLPLLPGYGPGSNFRSSIPVPSTSGKSLLTRLSEAEENGYQGTYFNAEVGKAPTTDGYISSSPVQNRRTPSSAPDTPEHEIPASASELEPMTASSETEAETEAETERAWTPPRPTPSPMRPPEEEVAEVVFFEYGVAVFFGLTEEQEKGILEDIEGAGVVRRKIAEEDWEVEACHFTHDPQVTYPRIYNDFFTLKSRSHLLKLSIAHALAQSTLLAHYESEARRVLMSPKAMAIPKQLATSGALQLRRHEALKLTGSLFKLRRDVNLVSNVLDVPELFWSEASLKELYDAVRDYMEIKPRVQVLNEKLGVASDFLDAIHDHLNNSAMERITWIIIWLIVVACLVELGEVIARLVVHATLNPSHPIRTLSRDEALRTLERMMVPS
ncbi:hypothetical protein PLEOSDRAFT_1061934 [Pleurotus ostreatus PC15]|uniref:DUF155 domain-containing protein n=1 Tax=Pleurotus ostreatus (strain PC15) TaxID=1137138 RepID=A0A067NUX4_PLEO1|nr:hypothetical protein PLEOSDRAFT_1061934 [Pleurotus ostreatus PC15]